MIAQKCVKIYHFGESIPQPNVTLNLNDTKISETGLKNGQSETPVPTNIAEIIGEP
jgi:hypothetical protein